MRRLYGCLIFLLSLFLVTPALATDIPRDLWSILHPRLILGGPSQPGLDIQSTRSPMLLLEGVRPFNETEIQTLESLGVVFSKRGNQISRLGASYSVSIDPGMLSPLAKTGLIQTLAPAWPQMLPPMAPWQRPSSMNHALETNGSLASRVLRNEEGERLTGQGQLICLLDSGIDPLHPLFFHADGGAFEWFDVNQDGPMTLGTDGVDWNQDGELTPEEVLQFTGGALHDSYTGEKLDWDTFQLNRQWLYLDLNQNGKRDHGAFKGFSDEDPGYGEPIFVAADLNDIKKLDLGEKLLLLGTSKVRAFQNTMTGTTYLRGVDLSSTPHSEEYAHGTGSAGILVGGVAGLTGVTGIAPSAELYVINRYGFTEDSESTFLDALLDCKEAGAKTFVHEYGGNMGEFADGGGPYETILDNLHAEGTSQVTATHNFASYPTHAIIPLAPGEELTVDVVITHYPGYTIDSTMLLFSGRWKGGNQTDLSMVINGLESPFAFGSDEGEKGDLIGASLLSTSTRNTHLLYGYIYRGDYGPIGAEAIQIDLVNQGSEPMELWLDLGDDNAYSPGIAIQGGLATAAGTMAHPSTADSAISVGAHACNFHDPNAGEVPYGIKTFSGRGPRIDGERGVDVIAPEDHFSAGNYTPWNGVEHGGYVQFGGTSGALPNVGGAVALLLESDPLLSPDEVRERIQNFSRQDANTGVVPNTDWGFGKLDVYRTIAMKDGPPLNPPEALWTVNGNSFAGETTLLSGELSSDGEPGNLTYRWDIGNTGEWTAAFLNVPTFETVIEEAGDTWVRFEVEDLDGLWSIALAKVITTEAPELPVEPDIIEEEDTTVPDTTEPETIDESTVPDEEDEWDEEDPLEEEFPDDETLLPSPLSTRDGCAQGPGNPLFGLLFFGIFFLARRTRFTS